MGRTLRERQKSKKDDSPTTIWEGERPMSITWRLGHPMPAEMFEETKGAAG